MVQQHTLQQRIRDQFPALVLLMVAGGFALTVVELVLMHHTEGKQLIGVGATGLGAVFALAGIWARGGARKIVVGLFAVLALTGLFGMVQHLEGDEDEREGFRWQQPAQAWLSSQTVAMAEEENEDEEKAEAAATASGSMAPDTAAEGTTASGSMAPDMAAEGTTMAPAEGREGMRAERRAERGEEGEEGEEGEHGAPPLAPLSVTGLALLGALALVAKPE